MAITTEGKINEMLRKNKADITVRGEWQSIKFEHDTDVSNRNLKKIDLENAEKIWNGKKKTMTNISLAHPIKKYKAYKEMQDARKNYKIKQKEYKIAKMKLKESQRKLREIRAEVRKQYRNVMQNEKMDKRVHKIQHEHYTSLSLQDLIEYNKQIGSYNKEKYHIDRTNPQNSTFVSAPRSELYSNINKTYARHLKEKAKAKIKDTKESIVDMTRQIGSQLRKNEPEVEM